MEIIIIKIYFKTLIRKFAIDKQILLKDFHEIFHFFNLNKFFWVFN